MAERWDDPSLLQEIPVSGDQPLEGPFDADAYPVAGPAANVIMKERYFSCLQGSLRGNAVETRAHATRTITKKRTVDVAATKSILRDKR